MKIIQDINEIQEIPVALTIGNFDGVHIGHQTFLNNLIANSHQNQLSVLVITFVPHPKQILAPRDHFLISDYGHRRQILNDLKVDYLLEIPFTRDFSTLSPAQFLSSYIDQITLLKKISVGHDFAFGANKSGSDELIKNYCINRGIDFEQQPIYLFGNNGLSSSTVRQALVEGDIPQVTKLLGREFSMKGVIVKGRGRGRQLGFSTANLSFASELIVPATGVYATTTIHKNISYKSITNIGHNPTFESEKKINVETHLINFDQDIYGETIEIKFLKRIRNEVKFNSVEQLVSQIKRDIESLED